MTNWKLSADYQLYKDGNYFWITLTDLTPGQEYRFQYAVERADGVKKQISDLYSEKVLHPDDQYEPKKVDPELLATFDKLGISPMLLTGTVVCGIGVIIAFVAMKKLPHNTQKI